MIPDHIITYLSASIKVQNALVLKVESALKSEMSVASTAAEILSLLQEQEQAISQREAEITRLRASLAAQSDTESLKINGEYAVNPPFDFENPEWEKYDRVQCWRNHIPDHIEEVWDSLTVRERALIAITADRAAANEHWD